MEFFKRILVDIDSDATVHPALDRAILLARATGAALTVTDVMAVSLVRTALLACTSGGGTGHPPPQPVDADCLDNPRCSGQKRNYWLGARQQC